MVGLASGSMAPEFQTLRNIVIAAGVVAVPWAAHGVAALLPAAALSLCLGMYCSSALPGAPWSDAPLLPLDGLGTPSSGCFAPLAAAALSSSSPMMMGLAPAWACGSAGSTLDVACGYAFQLALLLCWSTAPPRRPSAAALAAAAVAWRPPAEPLQLVVDTSGVQGLLPHPVPLELEVCYSIQLVAAGRGGSLAAGSPTASATASATSGPLRRGTRGRRRRPRCRPRTGCSRWCCVRRRWRAMRPWGRARRSWRWRWS